MCFIAYVLLGFIVEIKSKIKNRCKKPLFIIHNYMIVVNSRYFPWALCFILFLPTLEDKKPVMFKTNYRLVPVNHLYYATLQTLSFSLLMYKTDYFG